MDPTHAETAPPRRLKLRLLICNPKSYGPKNIQVKGRTSGNIPRTREDPYLPQCYSYECKSAAEWRDIASSISKSVTNQHSFFATAHWADMDMPPGPEGRVEMDAVVATVLADIPSVEIPQSQEGSEPSEAHNLGEAGATPAPATTFQIVTEPGGAPVPLVSDEPLSQVEQTEEPSDSNRAEAQASVESEGTFSAPDPDAGTSDPSSPESSDEASEPETAEDAAAEESPPVRSARVPASESKPKSPPAKKAAKGKK